MATELHYTTTEAMSLSLQSARLEQDYERVLRQAERIYEEERARALRVQLLLVEDENDNLRDQMREDEDEMKMLEGTNDDLRDNLAAIESDFQVVQMDLKTQLRDLERYKTEVTALNAANTDSNKLLSEKLSLSRELASLKPELEHLRSQEMLQHNLLANKLALERELNAANVELEAEKRTIQRLKSQDKTAGAGEAVMIDEIETLKKDLAKEKRNIQRLEREQMKKATEWDSQKEAFEGKLDAFRTKLRTTKEQLKEAQDESERLQAAKFAQATEATRARMNGGNPRKRNVARFDPDMTIGTPGNGGPAAKKQRTSVLPGDKSTFSITPFLNRTMSILPESPEEQGQSKTVPIPDTREVNVILEDEPTSVAAKTAPKTAVAKKTAASRVKPNQALKESTNPKANTVVKKPALAKVIEETNEEQENTESTKDVTDASVVEPAKKKKLLNRPTLFDDDEDTGPRRPAKKLNLTGLRGGGGLGTAKIALGGKNKVLAEFSPLKKDRRIAV